MLKRTLTTGRPLLVALVVLFLVSGAVFAGSAFNSAPASPAGAGLTTTGADETDGPDETEPVESEAPDATEAVESEAPDETNGPDETDNANNQDEDADNQGEDADNQGEDA